MSERSSAESAAEESKFLFKGTIRQTKASTLSHVPKADDTAIVHVDEILHAPPALARTLGQLITVKLAPGAKAKVGDQLLFHANGWIFGESIAVESVKQEKSTAVKTLLSKGTADPSRSLSDKELQQRVDGADVVLEGQVSSVHLPDSQRIAAGAASGARPISEHDPKWREAVIDVGAVHKGPSAKQVIVRFPSSTDVQWHRAPKFKTGDRGIWMLRRGAAAPAATAGVSKSARALAAADSNAAVYTALHPMDFQPANKIDAVAPVIRAAISGAHS